MSKPVVDFYFDFSCPWSYLALIRLRDATDRNAAAIALKPVSVSKLLATEHPELAASRLSANPAQANWQTADLQLWARFWGLTLTIPENWPFDANLAGAAAVACAQQANAVEFALQIFAAAFGRNEDIDDPAVLGKLGEAAGMEGLGETLAAAGKELAEVERMTEELIRRGGFGTPSMFVDDQLFFGNDRIPLVEWMLGPISDEEFVMPGQHSKVL